jgi:hypothetical protein
MARWAELGDGESPVKPVRLRNLGTEDPDHSPERCKSGLQAHKQQALGPINRHLRPYLLSQARRHAIH